VNITRISAWLLVSICAIFSIGCATPTAKLSNVPQIADNMAIGSLYIGPFVDLRKGGNVDTTILGTKRGGYGNPLGRVRDERGADEFVREHVISAAKATNIFAERKPDTWIVKRQNGKWNIESGNSLQDNRLILVGVINQLLVETMFSRGTEVNIDIDIISPNDAKVLWSSKLIGHETGGMGGGIFEDVDKLKNWLSKTLQDAALEKFATPEFQDAIKTRRE
jgi:hypothetical protein